jgi:hypothetical protein
MGDLCPEVILKKGNKIGGKWKRQNLEILVLITSYNKQSFKGHL